MPWLMASAQLGIGLLYVFPLWLTKLRKAPKLADGALGPLRYVAWLVCMLPRGGLAYGPLLRMANGLLLILLILLPVG